MIDEHKSKSLGEYFDGLLSFIIKSVGTILSYCGIPGLALILLFYFIEKHASSDQKRELIDSFLLLKNKEAYFLVFFYGVITFIAVLLMQHVYWKNKDKLQKKRIEELERTNTKLQDKLIKLKKN
ncbi:MAG: hypothetical protein JNK14_07855 [Chitinophagaceae bacterium]|nr:hypothetical protein [Chitinophagaceae bacterium]